MKFGILISVLYLWVTCSRSTADNFYDWWENVNPAEDSEMLFTEENDLSEDQLREKSNNFLWESTMDIFNRINWNNFVAVPRIPNAMQERNKKNTRKNQTAKSISIFTTTEVVNRGKVKLCDLPPFIDTKNCEKFNLTTTILKNCEKVGEKAGFIVVIFIGGIMIVLGNGLLPLVMVLDRSYRNRHNYIKVSLAVVDMITGGYLLCCVIPNAVWIGKLTQEQVFDAVLNSKNSALAIVFGSLILMTTQLSTSHLTLLSIERFIAIKFPFWHRGLGGRSVILCLLFLWMFAIFDACLPAMLKNHFHYEFHSLLLVYFLVLKRQYNGSKLHGTLYAATTVGLPYLITVTMSVVTAVIVWRLLASSKKLQRNTSSRSSTSSSAGKKSHTDKNHLKKEIALLKTTFIIILAFSLSLVPIVIVFYGLTFEYDDCSEYSLPYFVAFYLKMANSLSNVIVYSVRDKKFRKAVKNILVSSKGKILSLTTSELWSN